jgi:CBS domain-containing protein
MSETGLKRMFARGGKSPPPETVEEFVSFLRAHGSGEQPRVIFAQLDDTVAEAHQLFRTHDLHHLPIVSEEKVVGIVSATDLLTFFSTSSMLDPGETRLEEIMTPGPQVISRHQPVRDLVKILAHSPFRCLPVMDDNDKLWAIVTTRDLVHFLELNYE